LKIRLLHGPGYRSNKSLKRFLHQRAIARAFAQETVGFPAPDIIVCGMPLPELAEQAIIYGRKYHVPVVIDVRDQWPDIYLTMFPRSLRGLARLVLVAEFRRIERVFQSASAILSVSDTYLNWALKYAGRPRRSADGVFALGYQGSDGILNETDTVAFRARYGIRPERMVVTFVGIFGFSYDLETVVHAAKVLQHHRAAEVQIVLVGDGDAGPRLREMARGIPDLICTGWFDQKCIQILLSLSSVGLAAYTEKATQTLPNKPFEYLASGLPLLSSLRGELEDLIRNEQIGLQYQAGDVQSLVEKIVWLAEHQEERIAMGQRARKLFEERFRADVIYPKLVTHLEQVAANATTINASKLLA
jgi:glycosyltransferase involved in cell wall biosynthesis